MSNLTADERAIERMLATGLTLREDLAESPTAAQSAFWRSVVLQIETELAEHTGELLLACERLRRREYANARALLTYAKFLLDQYGKADATAAAALAKAARF